MVYFPPGIGLMIFTGDSMIRYVYRSSYPSYYTLREEPFFVGVGAFVFILILMFRPRGRIGKLRKGKIKKVGPYAGFLVNRMGTVGARRFILQGIFLYLLVAVGGFFLILSNYGLL